MMSLQPMFGRAGAFLGKTVQHEQSARGMATLKAISIRLKSVKNIQKITQSMKMVSAAKYARAERELKATRPLGEGNKKFYNAIDLGVTPAEGETAKAPEAKAKLLVAMTSDRGLCGAVHTTVARTIRNELQEHGDKIKVICVGDKARGILSRLYGKNILFVATEVGRLPPTFADAAKIANEILKSDYIFDEGKIIYNRFKSVVSYQTSDMPLFKLNSITAAPKISLYDSLDDDVLKSYLEFSIASSIFYALKEGACSEQSSRMTAMDNASKNAGEMIDKLTLTFNRTRQAVITRELIEIISGASAL